MAQVSPAINEVQKVETASWNSPSQPPTPPDDNVDITITDSTPAPTLADAYSFTTEGDPHSELEYSERLTPTGNPLPSDPMLTVAFEEGADVARSPKGATKDNISQQAKRPRTSPDQDLQDPFPTQPSSFSPDEKRQNSQPAGKGGSKITVTVEGADLWHQFYQAGTEMIITRAGRRMFPGIVISVSGLDPDSKYNFALEVNPADTNRYKYLNVKWVVVGKSDSHCEDQLRYVHPDSPASGRHWMANKVSFKKIKVTNNKSNRRGHVTLNSMHRYLPQLVISKYISKKNTTVVHTQSFPECSFIAVTAYQNDKVTQLKIDYNPFAKAFRDNPNEPDMYGFPGMAGLWPSSPLLHPYPYSPDGTGTMLSPSLPPPTPSPLPQFSTAFGMWDSPPCTPNAYRTQGLNGGSMLSPGLHPHTPSPLPQFSSAFHTWEAPPYSPNAYRSHGSNGVSHCPVGYAPPTFQPGPLVKMPPSHNPLVSQQLMAVETGLTIAKVESLHGHPMNQ